MKDLQTLMLSLSVRELRDQQQVEQAVKSEAMLFQIKKIQELKERLEAEGYQKLLLEKVTKHLHQPFWIFTVKQTVILETLDYWPFNDSQMIIWIINYQFFYWRFLVSVYYCWILTDFFISTQLSINFWDEEETHFWGEYWLNVCCD